MSASFSHPNEFSTGYFFSTKILHNPLNLRIHNIVTMLQSGRERNRVSNSRVGQETFLYFIASRQWLGPKYVPVHWARGGISFGLKRPGSEAYMETPSGVEIKDELSSYPSMPS